MTEFTPLIKDPLIFYPVIRSMSNNMKRSYPVVLLMLNHLESLHNYAVHSKLLTL